MAISGSASEAVKVAEEIGLPVVMKIVSPHILHKSDAGGVQVGLKTIEAVETFVDQHYQQQIEALAPQAVRDSERAILAGFEKCRLDEIHHRDDAKHRRSAHLSTALRLWVALVGVGSRAAVRIARLL